jgi:hypothetical protein
MSNTSYASAVLFDIRADRKEAAAKFAATKAIAEIGIVYDGGFTLNILNGPSKPNWNNTDFGTAIEAVKAYARAMFGNGNLKRNGEGGFLVY